MENRKVLVVTISVIVLLLPQAFTYAYEVPVHKSLTKNIITEYTKLLGKTFTNTDINTIIDGSAFEDNGTRPINHFYDPVHNVGLKSKRPTSKIWATNPYKQASYGEWRNNNDRKLFEGKQDYTWQRAVYEYAHGNKHRGLEALGHILHLVEDLTSVPHTRDDAHSGSWFDGSSVYEEYTAKLKSDIHLHNIKSANDIGSIMQETAIYTNHNFLSADTVFKDFVMPKRDTSKIKNHFMIGDLGQRVILLKVIEDKSGVKVVSEQKLKDPRVMQSYWEHLSYKAVESGVSVIDLFFREVEKERKTNKLAMMNKSSNEVRSIAKNITGFKGMKFLLGSSLSAVESYELNKDDWEGARRAAQIYDIDFPPRPIGVKMPKRIIKAQNQGASALQAIEQATIRPVPTVKKNNTPEPKPKPKPEPKPKPKPKLKQEEKPVISPKIIKTSLIKPVPVIPVPVPTDIVEAKPPIPTQEPKQEQKLEPKHTSTPNPFDPGGFAFGAGGGGGIHTPAPASPPDTTPPTITFTVHPCLHESGSSCFVYPGIEITYDWSTSDTDFEHFTINNSATTTISTSTTGTATTTLANNGDTQTITISATDTTGNVSTSTKTLIASTPSVVINEIFWGGTNTHPEDEWFELYNNEDYDIILDGWSFIATSSGLTVPLSGTISANSYFLVEPNEDTTSSIADLVMPFNAQMSDIKDTVQLKRGTTVIDEITPDNTNAWRAGFKNTGQTSYSMERFLPTGPSNDDANWGNASPYWHPETDRDGAILYGTPGTRNGTNYLFTYDNNMPSSGTLTVSASRSPYKLPYFTVLSGQTLTIEDGVIIEMFSEPHAPFDVQGILNVQGTASNPVIFTSDVANPGMWRGIKVNSGAEATLTHTQVLNGGYSGGSTDAAIKNTGGTLILNNATVASSSALGIRTENNATTTINNTLIKNNASHGLLAKSSVVVIDDTTFENNIMGIYHSHATNMTVRNSIFINNSERAIYHGSDRTGVYIGNSGSGNGLDGIFLGGLWMNSTGTTTLAYNSLPYAFSWLDIKNGTTLSLDPGVIMRGTYSGSPYGGKAKIIIKDGGTLHVSGTEANPVIFTSIKDPGGSPADSDWWGIVKEGNGIVIGASTTTALMKYADPTTISLW